MDIVVTERDSLPHQVQDRIGLKKRARDQHGTVILRFRPIFVPVQLS